jgi:hypothetical protein
MQAQTIEQVLRGKNSAAGGEYLGIHRKTFNWHAFAGYCKLGVKTPLQCVVCLTPELIKINEDLTARAKTLAPSYGVVSAVYKTDDVIELVKGACQ